MDLPEKIGSILRILAGLLFAAQRWSIVYKTVDKFLAGAIILPKTCELRESSGQGVIPDRR